jgi:hypothetical protein
MMADDDKNDDNSNVSDDPDAMNALLYMFRYKQFSTNFRSWQEKLVGMVPGRTGCGFQP